MASDQASSAAWTRQMLVELLAKETGLAVSYSRVSLYRTPARVRPETSCPVLIAGVGQAAAGGPRGEGETMGDDDQIMKRRCDRDAEMPSGRGDRGWDCPENLDRGVEGATDHG